jgi:hypothetical protein
LERRETPLALAKHRSRMPPGPRFEGDGRAWLRPLAPHGAQRDATADRVASFESRCPRVVTIQPKLLVQATFPSTEDVFSLSSRNKYIFFEYDLYKNINRL